MLINFSPRFNLLKKHKRGFALVEAVVSILILGIAVGAMLVVFMMGRVSIAMAKHHMEAMNHARAAMEQYINDGTITYTWPGNSDIESLNGSCSVVSTSYAAGIKKIVVTISWDELSMGSSHRVSEQLMTLVID